MVILCDLEDKMSEKDKRGPVFWKFLHLVSLFYDETNIDHGTALSEFLYYHFPVMIVCEECREHYLDFLEKNPPTFKDRRAFMEWVLSAHNNASKHSGGRVLTFDELLNEIDSR